jgi:coproporphyrinogen III oxidase-like Fe-S oxidoreductase
MATAESDDELFEAAIRDVEEAAKIPHKKLKSTASKSQTEQKREKLIELSKDGLIEKSAGFIRKSNKSVVDKLYDEY